MIYFAFWDGHRREACVKLFTPADTLAVAFTFCHAITTRRNFSNIIMLICATSGVASSLPIIDRHLFIELALHYSWYFCLFDAHALPAYRHHLPASRTHFHIGATKMRSFSRPHDAFIILTFEAHCCYVLKSPLYFTTETLLDEVNICRRGT